MRAMSPIGYGAFKIGRNTGAKYEQPYELPDDDAAERLLNGVLDLGVTHIDTAPAYGISEERIGRFLSHRRGEFVLSTKVGERFDDSKSTYDFGPQAVRRSVEQSLRALRTATIDILFVHAPRLDLEIARDAKLVQTLRDLRDRAIARCLGFSGYTAAACRAAMEWADALMLEYNANDDTLAGVIGEAVAREKIVVVKKGLASGRIPAEPAIRHALGNPGVTSLLVSSLSLARMAENVRTARSIRKWHKPNCRAESNG